jgi:alpha-D-ribose 1-methylphosphonate 5-phosphate C-P lyase
MLERSSAPVKVKGKKVKRPQRYKKLRSKKMSANMALKIANSGRKKK